MDLRNLGGFRVCSKLSIGENTDSRKCFIFINERWPKIKSVQDHIKNIFNIEEEVNIYIGDVLLPENETIKLIQPNDILIIKNIKGKKDDLCSKQFKSNSSDVKWFPKSDSPQRQKKFKYVPVSKREDSSEKILSNCLEELRCKKEEIVKNCFQDIDSGSTVNDSNEVEPLFGIPVKKRKRKHKKKLKVLDPSPIEETNTNKTDLMTFDSLDSPSKHIHFSDEEDSKERIQAHSSPKVNGNQVEEFRSSLRQLVNKPASQKIFSRKSETTVAIVPKPEDSGPSALESTTVNPDENKSEPIDSASFVPKVGDLISFKKIKLGNDYTPQQSNEIIGEVLTVEGTAGSYLVVFTIKEGAEEFEDPSGKFSIEVDENKLEGDKIHVAEMRWNDVIEPRLKRRV